MEIGECGGKAKSGVCDAENTTVSEETGNKPAQTEGMTGAVKRLDDNVFAIFGGRSRTPSLGSEGPPELTVCKGGPGKPRCGDAVKDGENGIRCDRCFVWYHSACQMVPKAAVNAAGRFAMLHWFCTSCHVSIFNTPANEGSKTETRDALSSFKKEVLDKVNEKVETMTKTVTDHIRLVDRALRHQEETAFEHRNLIERSIRQQIETKVSYAEMVKGSCAELAKEVSHKVDSLSNSKVRGQTDTSTEICTTVNSVLDKERRKLNVVISNLPESTPSDIETRETRDLRKFVDVIKDSLKLNVRALRCYRVGKIREDRPRLLVVSLENIETKQELLRMSSQLRNIPEWSNLYINPDLTPAEREMNRKLRQELAARRAAGENDIFIRRGSIVRLPKTSRSTTTVQPSHGPQHNTGDDGQGRPEKRPGGQ